MILKNKIKILNFSKILIIIIVLFGVFSVNPLLVDSAAEYELLTPLPGGPTKVTSDAALGDYLKNIFNLAIGLASVLAVLMIVMGGFKYIISETMYTKNDAKKQIQDALLGLLVALAAFLILKTINTSLTDFNLNLDKPGGTPVGTTPPPDPQDNPTNNPNVDNQTNTDPTNPYKNPNNTDDFDLKNNNTNASTDPNSSDYNTSTRAEELASQLGIPVWKVHTGSINIKTPLSIKATGNVPIEINRITVPLNLLSSEEISYINAIKYAQMMLTNPSN
ncbi:MAG: hypothetical protein KAJ58_00365 [Candidatus Pacebacteria bacterium]|nr:hypothetical protein [Candidatus Paceibacterota bacterium]